MSAETAQEPTRMGKRIVRSSDMANHTITSSEFSRADPIPILAGICHRANAGLFDKPL